MLCTMATSTETASPIGIANVSDLKFELIDSQKQHTFTDLINLSSFPINGMTDISQLQGNWTPSIEMIIDDISTVTKLSQSEVQLSQSWYVFASVTFRKGKR